MKFQRFDLAEPVDAVIGNVPFAKTTPFDPRHNRGRHSLHNYFLIKSLALYPTGRGGGGADEPVHDGRPQPGRSPRARPATATWSGALRLPGGAMRAVAGTEAVMDLLVLRRREPGADPHPDVPAWDRVVDVEVDDESSGEPATVQMNRYFAEQPDQVLGVTVAGRGMYRDGELMVRGDPDTRGRAGGRGPALDDRGARRCATRLRRRPVAPTSRRRRVGGSAMSRWRGSGWCRCARTASSCPGPASSTGTPPAS